MLKMDLAPYLLKTKFKKKSPSEKILLEIKLFIYFFKEFRNIFEQKYIDYRQLIKSNSRQEEKMLHVNFTQEMIKDILLTEEYSLKGIAEHIRVPQEVLMDVASGINLHPTFELSIKIFELHITVRREAYDSVMEKMISEYLSKKLQAQKDF